MSALPVGHAASLAALGAALIRPLVAVAARLTFGRPRKRPHRRDDHVRRPAVMDARIRAKLEATIWPE